MTNQPNVHTTATAVRDGITDRVLVHSALVRDDGAVYTASGMRVAPDEVRAREVAGQAHRWLAFATERTRMKPHTLTAKALASTAFSVHHGAASFAIPSKLTGTSEHQRALWVMVHDRIPAWTELAVDDTVDGLSVRYGDDALGEVQTKHLGWARPLVPFGLTLHLNRVTGHDYEAYTLGCNVVFGHVGTALDRLLHALGMSGPSGDGQAGAPPSAGLGVAEAAGTAPTGHLRLVVRPEREALDGDAEDVLLWRDIEGGAHASVPHVPRHSPTGPEWGYSGSGPADLARSVLLALTDGATAERLYQRFKTEVVARVPHAGGVLRAREVRAWVARHSA